MLCAVQLYFIYLPPPLPTTSTSHSPPITSLPTSHLLGPSSHLTLPTPNLPTHPSHNSSHTVKYVFVSRYCKFVRLQDISAQERQQERAYVGHVIGIIDWSFFSYCLSSSHTVLLSLTPYHSPPIISPLPSPRTHRAWCVLQNVCRI